jgi:MbtH protein
MHLVQTSSSDIRTPPDEDQYLVVVNEEEQYSVWRDDREPPPGWRPAGERGSKDECLRYIRETWTDIRPLSLRKSLAEG